MSEKSVKEKIFDKLDGIKDDLTDLKVKVSAISTHQKIQWWVIVILTGLCVKALYNIK